MEKTMDYGDKALEQLALTSVLESGFRMARKHLVAGVLLILTFAAGMGLFSYRSYQPVYEANVSFTVKVINPLYAAANGYNAQVAQQMEKTFPYVLSSNALQERVKKHMGVSYIPTVSAEVIEGTNVFTLRVRDRDPQRAWDVLEAVMTCYPEVAEFVLGPTSMVLLDQSGVPVNPVNSFSMIRSAALGAAAGGAIWLACCFLKAYFENTVLSEDQLQHLLNIPCLGSLPVTGKVGFDPNYPVSRPGDDTSHFREALHRICMRAERRMRENGMQVLLVSSAIPGEGKTTVSSNLAISLADRGKKVLLIDCDMRNPSVSGFFRMKRQMGLAEYLEGKIELTKTVRETSVKGLLIIPGGTGTGNTDLDTLLSSKQMSALVTAARDHFDHIILDTPPCGILADSSELAELADCAMMVVRQDYAAGHQIVDAVRYLTDSHLPLIGTVLNGTAGRSAGGYGYHYDYGYQYGKTNS